MQKSIPENTNRKYKLQMDISCMGCLYMVCIESVLYKLNKSDILKIRYCSFACYVFTTNNYKILIAFQDILKSFH